MRTSSYFIVGASASSVASSFFFSLGFSSVSSGAAGSTTRASIFDDCPGTKRSWNSLPTLSSLNFTGAPTINGAPINYAPARALDSPFLQSDWNSGVVTLRKGARTVVLNFNSPE